ncbi:DUF2516 family protein [Nonomuraea sp. NPDC001636]|uniref:DUF2516 family protein n=1 Tax=Nonomuraea sp. NPDC001636 TaxID=3154391 RepID=UPI00332BDC10
MNMINGVFNFLFLVLAAVIFGMSVYALVHAARVPTNAFVSAGKLQKKIWVLILALATLLSGGGALGYFNDFMLVGGFRFIGLSGLGLFSILAVIAATIYIVDVKPAVKGMGRGNSGPYGPW